MMKLYNLNLSGNCYKVRLLCSLLDIPLEIQAIDYLAGEHKSHQFMAINPLGEIPVLDDNGLIIRNSQAILIYIAHKYQKENWWPQDIAKQAMINQWLFIAENEIAHGPNDIRLHKKFNNPLNFELANNNTSKILTIINQHLAYNLWLATAHTTIADIACFPYIALAHEGGIDLSKYAHIGRWLADIKSLDNFIYMPGITAPKAN